MLHSDKCVKRNSVAVMENNEQLKKQKSLESPADAKESDFETAIESTGYGKFNYMLLMIALPCCCSSVFETTSMSLILPSAECELELTLFHKGVLNAITYGGMISSAILWGFISDVLGRKKLLVYGYLLDGIFNLLCAFSRSFVAISIFKFIGGFILCGPFAVLMSYLSELHGLKYRSRIMLSTGIFFSIGSIILPSLAWMIIPNEAFNIKLMDFELHTWQTFLLFCAFPSLLSGLLVCFLPESPKFLMSRGNNAEAMRIFRLIHRINNGSHMEYPIKNLINERAKETRTDENEVDTMKRTSKIFRGLRNGLSQMAVMLQVPHFKNACVVFFIQFCILFGLNTFRLWVVQLFAIIKEFEVDFDDSIDANLCSMIEYKVNKSIVYSTVVDSENLNSICEPNLDGDMFFNSMLISIIQLFAYVLASAIINGIGNKNLLVFGLLISGICVIGLYWAKDSTATLLLAAGYISLASVASTSLISSVVSLFPTSTRTMTVSLAMMFGRLGAIIGNLLFPWLLSLGCLPPFSMIGMTALVCSVFCYVCVPTTNKKALQ